MNNRSLLTSISYLLTYSVMNRFDYYLRCDRFSSSQNQNQTLSRTIVRKTKRKGTAQMVLYNTMILLNELIEFSQYRTMNKFYNYPTPYLFYYSAETEFDFIHKLTYVKRTLKAHFPEIKNWRDRRRGINSGKQLINVLERNFMFQRNGTIRRIEWH